MESQSYTLWINGGGFGFNTGQANIIGIPSAQLKQQWVHVVAIFHNGIPNVTDNGLYINGVKQTITLMAGETTLSRTAGSTLIVSGWDGSNDYRFKGRIANLQVWNRQLSANEIKSSMYKIHSENDGGFLGEWKLVDQPSVSKVFDRSNQVILATATVDTTIGGKNTVSFWMNWDGTENVMPFAWGGSSYALWFYGGAFGFNTGQGNIVGISSAELKQKWVHVTAIFYNGVPNTTDNELYIDGIKQSLSFQMGETTVARVASDKLVLSGWNEINEYRFGGRLGNVQVWNYAVAQSQVESFIYKAQMGSSNPERFMIW